MGIFNLVTPGAPTLASDINQYANVLNGTTPGGLVLAVGVRSPAHPHLASPWPGLPSLRREAGPFLFVPPHPTLCLR